MDSIDGERTADKLEQVVKTLDSIDKTLDNLVNVFSHGEQAEPTEPEVKDCKLLFEGNIPPHEFSSSTPIGLICKTAKEKNLPLVAISTPEYTLSVLTPEAYDAIANNGGLFDEDKVE